MIRQYSLAKDGNRKLAPDFKVREFRCKDGSDEILVDEALVLLLQCIREHFGKAVTITSGYRTPRTQRQGGRLQEQPAPAWPRCGHSGGEHQRGGRGSIRGKPAAQLGRRWPLSRQGRPGKGLGAR